MRGLRHNTLHNKVHDCMRLSKYPRLTRLLTYAGALAVLLATFAAYTRPDFLVTLADQLWSCF